MRKLFEAFAWMGRGRYNPLNSSAAYWKGKHGDLKRWVSCSFLGHLGLIVFSSLILMIPGCKKTYDLVKGSGKPKAMIKVQKVQIKKVTKKRILVNPSSPVIFDVPPIDLTPLMLKEVTANNYKVGQGDGPGPAGYAAGREGARFIFMRVRHSGNWDYNLRNGADENMTREFGRRAQMPVQKEPQDVTLSGLGNYVRGKAPPVVFMAGSSAFKFDSRDVKNVRQYLLENHGMIFGDNGGNAFHNAFLSLIKQALPEVAPVLVPNDDLLYQSPYSMNGCPPLWSHSGNQAMGWKKDGRWVVYYHQGSLTDAWKDTHGGTSAESAELSYQLGVNVLAQAMAAYSEWKLALDGKNKK